MGFVEDKSGIHTLPRQKKQMKKYLPKTFHNLRKQNRIVCMSIYSKKRVLFLLILSIIPVPTTAEWEAV